MRDINVLKSNNIDVDEGVRLLGDMETYDEILNDFLDGSDERLGELKKYYEENDMENYAIVVHALKSDSKYLGFTSLADMALEHQLKGEANDNGYVKEHYGELIDEYNRILNIIRDYLK